MEEFNFYNSENDGYRGSFGDYTDPEPVPPFSSRPAPQKRGGKKRIAALILACAVVGGASGVGGAALYGKYLAPTSHTSIMQEERPKVQTIVNTNSGQPMTPEQLYAANLASCVGITVNTTVNIFGQTTTSAASGSGFVLTQDGYIVTNYHVIEEAAENSSVTIEVSFANGNKYDAKLVGGEKDNDVAVLKIDAEGLTPVILGDSDNLVVGEQVCAIGNPLGELTFTYTSGSVSARDRTITMENGEIMNMLQTDTAINSGNSGGPLFNMFGQVIGITTAKYSSSGSSASVEGIGFAIPINDVKDMVKDIMEKGYVTGKPNVGILMEPVSSEATQRYGIPAGAYIAAVLEGSCAERSDLRVGDIVTAVDSAAVTSPDQLKSAVKNYKAGDTVVFTVFQEGAYLDLTLTLDEDDQAREAAMAELLSQYQQAQQPTQQQPSGNYGTWPFNFFGW